MSPLLLQIERRLRAQIPSTGRGAYRRLVAAGTEQLPGTRGPGSILERCQPGLDLPRQAATLLSEVPALFVQPEGKAPVPHGMAAGFALMVKVLDVIERETGQPTTAALIDATTRATADALLGKMGVTVDQIERAAEHLGQERRQ